MPDKKICFVIMPFSETTPVHTGEYWTKHFANFLKPIIEDNSNFEARKSEALRVDILKQIITDLLVSSVAVADLTDYNPNVYWELGVRQSFKHGTVTIAEEGTKLPFDIGGNGTIFYRKDDSVQTIEFQKKLKLALQDCLSNPHRPDSCVLEAISGRGTLFEIFRREEAKRRLDTLLSECQDNLRILQKTEELCTSNQEDPKKRVLVIDLDAQANLTTGLGFDPD